MYVNKLIIKLIFIKNIFYFYFIFKIYKSYGESIDIFRN